jgi:sec-independent protein translocase protein TatC
MSDPLGNGTPPGDSLARDPDDFFSETRMSFGDHIEELRLHLWRAIGGLAFCLVIGFVLDAIGYYTEWRIGRYEFGIGRPLMQIIQQPVEDALRDYKKRDREKQLKKAREDVANERKAAEEANKPREIIVHLSPDAVAQIRGVPVDKIESGMDVKMMVKPLEIEEAIGGGKLYVEPTGLSALSVQEALVVYFKVSLVAGLVIASPWVFWQIWSFVAAGLYPHEKKLIHVYLPFSLGLFLAGVFVCQFLVMPQAVAAMLWFNEWLGITPELRLNEWLSFAIWMPVIFGVSFQTPLVMLFTGKLGIADVPFYADKRKYAYFAMCVFAAIITPSPDAITMLMLAVPMCLLYELGIILIKFQPPSPFEEESETDELVEV